MYDFNKTYNILVICKFFTNEELQLVTAINGSTVETLNHAIYARYGLRNLKQLLDFNEEE